MIRMTLKDYKWEDRYRSGPHNLLEEFYIPALSRSRYYYRIAGYFSSTSIAAAFRGVSAFAENGEKMLLVIGADLSEEDVDAIKKGIKSTDDVLKRKWNECKEEFENDTIKKRFEILSWLLSNDKLEIQIGFRKDENGNMLSSNTAKFHEKVLIFEDYEGNQIHIDGSINETWHAWKKNREGFSVHRSWVQGQSGYIKDAKREFDNIWNNSEPGCEIMDAPKALVDEIVKIRPKGTPDPDAETDFDIEPEESEDVLPPLRRIQREAIDAWIKSGYKGVLEMATGTGKTRTALEAVKSIENWKPNFLIVAVPQKELAKQWYEECEKVLREYNPRTIICHSDTMWKKDIARLIRQSDREGRLCIIIAVLGTMRTPYFQKKVSNILENAILIIDEVHEVGSKQNRKLFDFLDAVRFRLGLSATPERLWDEEGNKKIQRYFDLDDGKSTFIWDIEKAIRPPEGYEKCLSNYYYYLHECHLTGDELENYEDLSRKISRKYVQLTRKRNGEIESIEDEPSLRGLLNQRANIIKECSDKLRVLTDIVNNSSKDLTKCLIYNNKKYQAKEVTKQIMHMGFTCKLFYGDMFRRERDKVFDEFKNSDLQFISAIKCLDQGVDIPICNSAIILASSKNPREFVQRRGRILRLHETKEFSIVHDILVLPYSFEDISSGKKRLTDFETRILKNQLNRIKIFIENSENKHENYLKLLEYRDIIASG